MSETATNRPQGATPDRDPDSAWLAAYALGLAYSSDSEEQQIELLLDATHGQPELLEFARQRLATTEVVDTGLREAADQLLHRARTLHTSEVCQTISRGNDAPLRGS